MSGAEINAKLAALRERAAQQPISYKMLFDEAMETADDLFYRIEALKAALARVERVDNSLAKQLSGAMALIAEKTTRIETLEAALREIEKHHAYVPPRLVKIARVALDKDDGE